MKYLLSLILIIALNCSYSQQNGSCIFSSINLKNLDSSKPTIFFTLVSWCGENLEDITFLNKAFKTNRDKINFVVLLDTNLSKNPRYYKNFLNLKSDKIISLNECFPTCFKNKKEAKDYAKQINKVFNTTLKIVGPSTMFEYYKGKVTFFFADRDNKDFIDFLNNIN